MKATFTTLLLLCTASSTWASVISIDLTTGAGSSGTNNGAIYEFFDDSGGTGLIHSFVRLQKNGSEDGYNTSGRPLPSGSDAKTSLSFTHDIQLGSIPIVLAGASYYFEFLLDINENNNGKDNWLSLDDVQIYMSSTPSQTVSMPSDLGALAYEMENPGLTKDDDVVLLDFNQAAGSGVTDMRLLVPVSNFRVTESNGEFFGDADLYVYLYSAFGYKPNEVVGSGNDKQTINWDTSDGIEEWAVRTDSSLNFLVGGGPLPPTVPEPSTYLIFGGLALSFGLARWWRKRKQAAK